MGRAGLACKLLKISEQLVEGQIEVSIMSPLQVGNSD
jgi:hypothetical protein